VNWKFFVRMALPMLRMAGEEYKNRDDNNTGKDDLIGTSLVYAADLVEAAIAEKPKMPAVPNALK
jgi:hypothetical protein